MTTTTQSITIQDLIILEQLGAHVHTYRVPSSLRLRMYISNLQDISTKDLAQCQHIQDNTRCLVNCLLKHGEQVLTLI